MRFRPQVPTETPLAELTIKSETDTHVLVNYEGGRWVGTYG